MITGKGVIGIMLEPKEEPERVQSKLTAAVGAYFIAHAEGLRRYAYTLLRDEDEAKDSVQAVFLKLWEKKENLDDRKSIKSYLYTAVYNHCLNIKRHEKVRQKHLAAESKTAGYEEPPSTAPMEDSNRINMALKNLPPRCKEIFVKSRLEGKKYAAIATELDISIKTVEVQMGKALKILRKALN